MQIIDQNKQTPGYNTWVSIKQRCYNPNAIGYSRYGGRGIEVCDRWLSSFKYFIEDMGKRPSNKHSLDRIDSSGNYTPKNCRWATANEQARNRGVFKNSKSGFRGVNYLTYKGGINKWRARIRVDGTEYHIGSFRSPEEAAIAYDLVALQLIDLPITNII